MISIYLITNKINGKKYVGKTRRELSVRWQNHKKNAENGELFRLSCAIRKYGFNAFTIEEIDQAETKEDADAKENSWILAYKSYDRDFGYNMTLGGDGLDTPSEETRLKMSEAKLGSKHTEEWKKAASDRMKGNQFAKGVIFSEERKAKQAEYLLLSEAYKESRLAMRGKKHSKEHNAKISASITGVLNPFYGRKHTEETKQKMRLAKQKGV